VAQTLELRKGAEPFPGYRLVQFLGRGGWGEVWKAQPPQGEPLALKFLPTESQLAAVQEVRALQSIRQLHHENLIHIEQIWCCAGYLVIAMEMAEGSLLDLFDVYLSEFNTPIFADHLCFFLSQAAAALDFLNTRQHHVNDQRVAIRHCDVKPSNLLIKGRTVKLADFSLSVLTTSPMWFHRRWGTLNYAGPEVFVGRLSEWTDEYALAVTYCQLRGGRLPFADTPDQFTTTYVRPAPDLSMLSKRERPIIARALDPVPQNRWPTCTEMMQHLASSLTASSAQILVGAR